MKLILFLVLLSTNLFAQNILKVKGQNFSFYSNMSLVENHNIDHAIITIHGSARNPETYLKSVVAVSKKLGREQSTLVVSPHFKIAGDTMISNELFFSYEGWWIGDQSLTPNSVSSFEVIEKFINTLASPKLFPNLKTIVITGHSAGGHLTQRLALGTQVDKNLHGVELKFIVANPGTYAYLSNKRPVPNLFGVFEVPKNPGCAYNHYKYGLEKLNPYMLKSSKTEMISNFIQRDVTYFLGEADTGEVEQTCEASLQGPHRFARGKNFKAHVDEEYPQNIHQIIIVPNVGHTQYGMYTSSMGTELLF